MSLTIRDEPYDGPVVQRLVDAVQAEYAVRYGGTGDQGPIHSEEFAPPDGRFLVGYDGNTPVAMGGVRRHGDAGPAAVTTVEIKRMYVVPQARGRGLSRQLLAALEDAARSMGARRIVLETGLRQPEAIALYETSGYEPIEGFGYYKDAPLSAHYGKTISD